MLNIISTYMLVGIIFGILVEIIANIARKHGHNIEHFNNVDRVLIVAFWPIALIIFLEALWRVYTRKDK
jgi:hypothetical protein